MRIDHEMGFQGVGASSILFEGSVVHCTLTIREGQVVVTHRETDETHIIGPVQESSREGVIHQCPWCDAVD